MSVIYATKNGNGLRVELCQCTHKANYKFAITVDRAIKGYAAHIGDAYRLYNEMAR